MFRFLMHATSSHRRRRVVRFVRRSVGWELLEDRCLLATTGGGLPDGAVANFFCSPEFAADSPFCQPPADPPCPETEFPDVNGDGQVNPSDALLLINHINMVGSGQPAPQQTPPVLDLNCDGLVTAADVMVIINYLNSLAADDDPDDGGFDLESLLEDLQSAEGEERLAATNQLLDLGPTAAPALAFYGAQQISRSGNIFSQRVDVVFSLLNGLRPDDADEGVGYLTDSLGLQMEPGTTAAEVDALGQRYGFFRTSTYAQQQLPNCYVMLHPGNDLSSVIEQLLRNEQSVVSVNLNYYVV